jgi:Rod binding domain-containing protein
MIEPAAALMTSNGASALSSSAAPRASESTLDPKALKAARDFEAIFLRTLLSSLEKASSVPGQGRLTTGQSTYGSMVVGALADQISSSGGIGLAEIVARSLSSPEGSAPKPPK